MKQLIVILMLTCVVVGITLAFGAISPKLGWLVGGLFLMYIV